MRLEWLQQCQIEDEEKALAHGHLITTEYDLKRFAIFSMLTLLGFCFLNLKE
jgi:hypothetical protein